MGKSEGYKRNMDSAGGLPLSFFAGRVGEEKGKQGIAGGI
jgi:hypothetical protein